MPVQRIDEPSPPGRRPYRSRRRLAAMDATRARIVDAAFQLHATVGPSRTSIAAIAQRAGVQRHTVYRHFADLDALYEACTRHGMEVTGMPDPAAWRAIADPTARLERALVELSRWYRTNERMLTLVLRDEEPDAPAGDDPFSRRMAELAQTLIEPWSVPAARREVFGSFVRHAIEFTTWCSLRRSGMADGTAIALTARIARGIADGTLP